jgi:hypothetical protein
MDNMFGSERHFYTALEMRFSLPKFINSQKKNNFPKTRFRFAPPSAIDNSERK